jgi:hypothetical protein
VERIVRIGLDQLLTALFWEPDHQRFIVFAQASHEPPFYVERWFPKQTPSSTSGRASANRRTVWISAGISRPFVDNVQQLLDQSSSLRANAELDDRPDHADDLAALAIVWSLKRI